MHAVFPFLFILFAHNLTFTNGKTFFKTTRLQHEADTLEELSLCLHLYVCMRCQYFGL